MNYGYLPGCLLASGLLAQASFGAIWEFNENVNEANNLINSTANGSVTYVDGATPNSKAIQFTSSTSDYVRLQNNQILNLSENTDFTIELVFKINGASADTSATNWIISKNYANASAHGWGIYWNDLTNSTVTAGTVSAIFGGSTALTSTATVNDGKWHAIAITHAKDSGKYTLYVDGVEQSSINYTGGAVSSDYLYIGTGFGWQTSRDFIGAVDTFKISSAVLEPNSFLSVPEPAALGLFSAIPMAMMLRKK